MGFLVKLGAIRKGLGKTSLFELTRFRCKRSALAARIKAAVSIALCVGFVLLFSFCFSFVFSLVLSCGKSERPIPAGQLEYIILSFVEAASYANTDSDARSGKPATQMDFESIKLTYGGQTLYEHKVMRRYVIEIY